MVSTEAPLSLHRQHQAGTNDLAVHAHRAGAADPMLTPDMRAGQLQMFSQEIRQIESRQHLRIDAFAIDVKRDGKEAVTQVLPR